MILKSALNTPDGPRGKNTTLISQLSVEASVNGDRGQVCESTEKFPVAPMPAIVRGADPVLVRVTGTMLVVPERTSPKLMDAVDRLTAGAGKPVPVRVM